MMADFYHHLNCVDYIGKKERGEGEKKKKEEEEEERARERAEENEFSNFDVALRPQRS